MLIDTKGNVRMTRGDTEVLNVDVTDLDDHSVDLTGATATLTARNQKTDEIAFAVSGFAADSAISFYIMPEDTQSVEPGKYEYDIEVILADGTVGTVKGGANGKVIWDLVKDVTRHGA